MALLPPRLRAAASRSGAGDLTRERRDGPPVDRHALAAVRRAPELVGLVALAALLNLWALGATAGRTLLQRGGALDEHELARLPLRLAGPSGVMTVDKPPLALWVQSLSVRVFGFHPLAILVPQALMGIATVVLVYDLVRRRFGRLGGFVAGLALATTPITVAMSRHNNPDALLDLCCVAAVWFAVRAARGRAHPLARARRAWRSGWASRRRCSSRCGRARDRARLAVGRPARGRLAAIAPAARGRRGDARVGGAWPLLVMLTPRPTGRGSPARATTASSR
jgi:hypothetical protein